MRAFLMTLIVIAVVACSDESPLPPAVLPSPAPTSAVTVTAIAEPTPTPCIANTSACHAASLPTATPLSLPRIALIDGLPEGAVGPLLVYRRQLRHVATGGGIAPIYEVITYDLGARKPLLAFEAGTADSTPYWMRIGGREIVTSEWDGARPVLRRFALDGTKLRETLEPAQQSALGWMAMSRDGALLASDVPDRVAIIDAQTGVVLVSAPSGNPPFGTLVGAAWELTGRWAVFQAVNPHWATGIWLLSRDGALRQLAASGDHPDAHWRIAPDGRYAARRTTLPCVQTITQGLPPCAFSQTGFIVRALESNRDIASVTLDEVAQIEWWWSLDGEELLYSTRRPARTDSQNAVEWLSAPRTWYLLDLRTGKSTLVGDVSALERGLLEPWRVVLACESDINGTVIRQIVPIALGTHVAFGGCNKLTVDGNSIDTSPGIEVLGAVDVQD